jgi:hypothetical protein
MKTKSFLKIAGLILICLLAGTVRADGQRYFPDLPEYKTLVCDFHTHTVFSDGLVWPTVRVDEALRENLDALAITDHIEYQPHKDDIPTKHGRSYEIAVERAKDKTLLLIKGAEITRDTPPGHYNALFLTDINPLETPELLDVLKAANSQGGLVFWNHHTWKGDDKGQWEAIQTAMYENKWLHGMEVANGEYYYPQAFQWCLEKKLTMFGDSDIHDPAGPAPYTPQQHRTVTLVFAKERSVESIREALFAGRTAVWQENRLFGRQEFLLPLFEACVKIAPPQAESGGRFRIEIINSALIDLDLQKEGTVGPDQITVPARSSVGLFIGGDQNEESADLLYRVRNFLIAPDKGLPVALPISAPEPALVEE